VQFVNIDVNDGDDDEDDDVCVIDKIPSSSSHKAASDKSAANHKKSKKKKRKKSKKHKGDQAPVVIDLNNNSANNSGMTSSAVSTPALTASCNPLSDQFCAVDYLKHRTPLYQVNTINIDNIYTRKGELSTAHFVVGDWKFRVLVYPFGVDNPSYSLHECVSALSGPHRRERNARGTHPD